MTEKVVRVRGEEFMTQGRESGVTGEHPLHGFWLSHRLLQGNRVAPFKSIMHATTIDEARTFIAATGKSFDGDYVEERRSIEAWLKTEGVTKGLVPDDDHPIYLRLYRQPVHNPTPGWTFINIPAEQVPPDKMTFTLDDSFNNYATLTGRTESTTPPNIQPRVLSASEVRQLIDTDGFPDALDGRNPTRYIECQVWSRELPILEQVEELIQKQGADLKEAGIITFTQH